MILICDIIQDQIQDPATVAPSVGGILLNASLYSGPKTHCVTGYRDLCSVTVRLVSDIKEFEIRLYKAEMCLPAGTQKLWTLISECKFVPGANDTNRALLCCDMDLAKATTISKRFDTDDALMLVLYTTGNGDDLGFINGEISYEMLDGNAM